MMGISLPPSFLKHGSTETIFAQPSDPRTKAYTEGTFG
jgi:hypothetical protein